MILTISIPDKVYKQYVEHDTNDPSRAIERTLLRYAETGPAGRALTLPKETLAELEKIFQTTFETPAELLNLIKRLVSFSVEGAEFTLSPSQMKRISSSAEFFKQSTQEFLKGTISTSLRNTIGS